MRGWRIADERGQGGGIRLFGILVGEASAGFITYVS